MSNTRKIRRSNGPKADRASTADRRYFAQHPDAETYTRPVRAGEFGADILPSGERVTVTQLAPGVRLRQVKL